MDKLLTLKEMASRLGVPESNLRYYRNRIGDFLPSAGKGRRRRYFPEAEEIFKRTIDYINEGVSLDRIYAIFAENKPLALKEEIARPAQEELAGIIIDRLIAAKQEFFQDALREGNNAILLRIGGVGDDLSKINNLLQRHFFGECRPESNKKTIDKSNDIEQMIAVLKKENDELKQLLDEKERIMEGQKKALLDARDKRRLLQEEIDQLKGQLR